MGTDPLAGCIGKVQRAGLHLEALHAQISPFLESEPKPYRFMSKVDVESACYRLIVIVERQPPMEWSLIAGDFLQNLRAALDHLVWQLVAANGAEPTFGNAFPIFDEPPPRERRDRQRRVWQRMLRGVHRDAIDYIESCQPYRGEDGPTSHLLWALRELSNEDKHRTVIPALTAIQGRPEAMDLRISVVRDVGSLLQGAKVMAGEPLKSGDLVVEAPVKITGPNPELKLEGNFPLDVGFGNPPVPLQNFARLVHAISGILGDARQFIQGR